MALVASQRLLQSSKREKNKCEGQVSSEVLWFVLLAIVQYNPTYLSCHSSDHHVMPNIIVEMQILFPDFGAQLLRAQTYG